MIKCNFNIGLLIFSALFPWIVRGQAVEMLERGAQLAKTCAACHGPTGQSTMALMPSLAGQHTKYLLRQMRHYKDAVPDQEEARFHAVMTPLIAPLSIEDMQALAEYYSRQVPALHGATKTRWSQGRQLYQGGDRIRAIAACKGCHGPAGEGNAQAGFPALSGQQPEYIAAQLKAYQSRIRRNDPHEIMRTIAMKLTEEDIQALANYCAGLYHSET